MSQLLKELVVTVILSAALAYARIQRWRVFPCHSWVDNCCTCGKPDCTNKAKHPLTPSGCKDATLDADRITEWWHQTQGYPNVGIATGSESGLVVVDVDIASGGLDSLNEWVRQHGDLPTTPTVQTGGGGRHFYFKYPTGCKVGNRAKIVPGIDVRGDGGYVLAPPSNHACGKPYEWLVPPETPLAELPGWLLDAIILPRKTDTASHSPTPSMVLKLAPPTPDLTNSPGVAKGQRHDTLCRLVGVHLARKEALEAIEVAAFNWAATCTPPMEASEVHRTVQSLAAKHQQQAPIIVISGDDVDATPLPLPVSLPVMHANAYFGLPGKIVTVMEPHTEADPSGLLLTLLVGVGNCMGRLPRFPVEGDYHHLNLFSVLVGESSRGRKGTSMGRVMSLLEIVDPDWYGRCRAAGLASGEGLIWAVHDPVIKTVPVKEKGVISGYQDLIEDPGVDDKRLLVTESEFAQALRVLGREGNTLSAIIRQAWDSGSLKALTKHSLAQATNAHISIVGHITLPELTKYLDDTDCFNGFANRFLWAVVRRSKLLPDGGENVDLAPLQQELAVAVTKARTITTMTRTPEARSLWRQAYTELTAEKIGLYGAVTGRAEAQVLRLSMLYALLDGKAEIDVPHLQAALALWRYCDASAKVIFGQENAQAEDPLEQQLLGIVRQQPGINRRGLHKALGGHVQAKVLVQALAILRDRNLIRPETVATGGRPSECWFAVQQTNLLIPQPTLVVEARTNSHTDTTIAPASFARSDAATDTPATPDSSLARTAGRVLSLPDLFAAVQQIGGRIQRAGDRLFVDARPGAVTPDMEAALEVHRGELLPMLPAPPTPQPDYQEMSEEQFMAELDKMKPGD